MLVELNDIDESKATVYFPGENDTQIVKVWDLRPSMQWEDGKWAPLTNSATKVPAYIRFAQLSLHVATALQPPSGATVHGSSVSKAGIFLIFFQTGFSF